jgi:CheY-like chemotaxis protein
LGHGCATTPLAQISAAQKLRLGAKKNRSMNARDREQEGSARAPHSREQSIPAQNTPSGSWPANCNARGMSGDDSSRKHVVLLVDDDLRTTRRLADMLGEDGLMVEIARDGAAAVARFTHAPVPDALVTELITAHVDAASLSRFARIQRPGLPVLVVTGYPNLFQPDNFGGTAPLLFTKPVEYSKLKDALVHALSLAEVALANPAPETSAVSAEPGLES